MMKVFRRDLLWFFFADCTGLLYEKGSGRERQTCQSEGGKIQTPKKTELHTKLHWLTVTAPHFELRRQRIQVETKSENTYIDRSTSTYFCHLILFQGCMIIDRNMTFWAFNLTKVCSPVLSFMEKTPEMNMESLPILFNQTILASFWWNSVWAKRNHSIM